MGLNKKFVSVSFKVVISTFVISSLVLGGGVLSSMTFAHAEDGETVVEESAPVVEETVVETQETEIVTPPVEEETLVVEEETPVVEEEATSETDSPETETTPTIPTFTTISTSPTLTTDKEDYHPGETATILGNFFQSLQNIVLKIFGGSQEGGTYTESNVEISTNDQGSFGYQYKLDEWFRPLYTVVALNFAGEELARTTFTDAINTNFHQCANKNPTVGDCDWIGSILQSSNSEYYEGQTVAQRVIFRGVKVPENSAHTISFGYQYTKGGTHAYDFIATVDPATGVQGGPSVNLNVCDDLTGAATTACNNLISANNKFYFDVPTDFFDSKDAPPGSAQSVKESNFETATSAGRKIVVYAPSATTISNHSVSPIVHSPSTSNSDTADSTATLTMNFELDGCSTGSGCDLLVFFGGHVSLGGDGDGSSGFEWGSGLGASSISGGPYHIKDMKFDGTGGSLDNPIQGSQILPPAAVGTIVIIKDTVPDAAQDFTFTGTLPTFSLDDDEDGTLQNTSTTTELADGVYTVTEGAVAGYAVTISCTDGSGGTTWDDNARTATINLTGVETVTCTFTNTLQQAHLTLQKTVVKDNGGTAVDTDWTLSASGPTPISGVEGNAAVTNAAVNSGTYNLSESGGPNGYTASDWVCTGGTQNDGDTVTLAPGDNATCVITNDDNAPSLTLLKTVTNDNGGTALNTAWTLTATGVAISPTNLSGTTPVASGAGFKADTYTLGETGGPAGYTASTYSCVKNAGAPVTGNSITLGLGDTATCTINNNDNAAHLVVIKHVINDNGGTAVASDFTLNIGGVTAVGGNSVTGTEAPGVDKTLSTVGAYTVTETGITGYSQSSSADCSGTIALGETKTCTITNDDIQPKLTVIKNVVNDDGGNAVVANFPLFVNATPVTSGVQNGFNAGNYTVSETGLTGYTAGPWGTDCAADGSITLAPGDEKTCMITNDDQPAHITLIKVVINDNGGNAGVNDFGLFVGATDVDSGVTTDVDSNTPITIGEVGLPGYTLTGVEGNAKCIAINNGMVSLNESESITCTLTNDDIAPSLTLVKVVTNDNGGTEVESAWTLTAAGPTGFSGFGPSVPNGASFDAGTYDLSESGPVNYTASDWVCVGGTQDDGNTITLGLGDSVTCTITNDDDAPKLTLNKIVINDNGGTALESAWTLTATGPTTISGPGAVGVTDVVSDATFDAGAYVLSESTGPVGYSASSWTCSNGDNDGTIDVALGDDITCTITNDDQPGHLIVHKVTDPASDTTTEFSITASGGVIVSPAATQPITGGSSVDYTVNAGTYNVTEAAETGWDETDNTCVNVVVANGATEHCTITNTELGVISGKKFEDLNGDHVRTNGTTDPNLPGWTIRLDLVGTSNPPHCESGTVETASVNGEYCEVQTDSFGNYEFINLFPGDYIVSEVLQTGWTQTRPNDSFGGAGAQADGTYHLTLTAGQVINDRQFGNFEDPKLTVIKHVVSDDGGNADASDFTLHVKVGGSDVTNSPAVGTEVGTLYTLEPGTFVVSEDIPISGYEQTGISGACDPSGTVTLQSGDDLTCTITNNDIAPTLKLVKQVTNDNGGTAVAGDWDLTADDGGADPNDFTDVGDSATFHTVTAGVGYDLSESTVSGYTAGSWSCNGGSLVGSTITLGLDEDVTCTITNDDISPRLIVIKHVINDNGGQAVASDFTLDSGGTNDTPDDFAGAEAPGTDLTLNAGAYNVTETGPAGYSASFSADCSGAIALGETKTCTVTNDDIAPQLILDKVVVNDNGGNNPESDWTLTASGPTPLSGPGAVGANDVASDGTFAQGTYTLSESVIPGYTASAWICTGDGTQNGSDVTLDLAETMICTITNNDQPAQITLIKSVTNDNNGNAQPDDFDPTIDAGVVLSGSTTDVNSNTAHTLNETLVTGYSFVSITGDAKCPAVLGGNTQNLNEGEHITCTITNDDIAPILHLRKVVVNDNGGTALDTAWTLTADGTTTNDLSGTTPVNSGATLKADTFALSENGPVGYAASAWVCVGGTQNGSNITLGVGEEATCTITNDDIAPRLIVIKHVINDNGGTNVAGDFTMNVTATNPSDDSFSGVENPGTVITVFPGPYSVTETGPSGYIGTSSADCSGTIAIGETKICTWTNDDTPGHFTGGGSVFPSATSIQSGGGKSPKDTRVTHGFTLHCDVNRLPNRLEVNWGPAKNAQKFHLLMLDTAMCTDNPDIDPQQPRAEIDTIFGTGTGRFQAGKTKEMDATIEFTFTDDGEPGRDDTANIIITVPGLTPAVVLDTGGALNLNMGNQQAHQDN
jgi:hypothetical protein